MGLHPRTGPEPALVGLAVRQPEVRQREQGTENECSPIQVYNR